MSGKTFNKEILKDKNRKIVSSKEALKDVEPLFNDEELKKIKEKNIKILIK